MEMEELDEATLMAGKGIEGDRYFLGNGTYSKIPDVRDVTLIESEVLEALARNDPPLQTGPIILEPHDHRRNLTCVYRKPYPRSELMESLMVG